MRDYKDAGTRRPSKLSLRRALLPIRPIVLALVALLVAAAAAWLVFRPGAGTDPVSATASKQPSAIPLTLPPPSTPTKSAPAGPMEPQD